MPRAGERCAGRRAGGMGGGAALPARSRGGGCARHGARDATARDRGVVRGQLGGGGAAAVLPCGPRGRGRELHALARAVGHLRQPRSRRAAGRPPHARRRWRGCRRHHRRARASEAAAPRRGAQPARAAVVARRALDDLARQGDDVEHVAALQDEGHLRVLRPRALGGATGNAVVRVRGRRHLRPLGTPSQDASPVRLASGALLWAASPRSGLPALCGRRRRYRPLARRGAPDHRPQGCGGLRPALPQVGRESALWWRCVAGRLRRERGRAHRHGVRLLPAAARLEPLPPLLRRRRLPRRGEPRGDALGAARQRHRRRLRPAMRAGLRRPQVLLPAALHYRRRAQGGHHLAVQVSARAPRCAPRRRQGAHLLGQLLLAQEAAEPRRRDGRLPPKVPKDLAERLQGDGRGNAGLPLLPHLPHLHPQVHAQGTAHLHAARPGASRLLRVPKQGRRPHGRAVPEQAHRQQDGEGALGRRAALLCARRRRGQNDGVVRLAQPDLFDDGRILL
mmetsp:Transcript_28650/g.90851  ORF Transcript_28650/g.90851 Transcript_28650/m.90851 type:complete len:508 (-) Transcript_28650:535-2058(-)